MKFTSKLTADDAAKISGLVHEVGAAWEAIPDDIADNTLTDSYDTLADAITALVANRDEARALVSGLIDRLADGDAVAKVCRSDLKDAQHKLVRIAKERDAIRAERDAAQAAIPDDANERENDAATAALRALREYMYRLDEAGTLMVGRVLGWLDHAIDGADQ